MSRRYQLTNAQWGLISPLFPHHRINGRPTREPRQVLGGILWILYTGAPWRDLPERFGPWNSVYNTFRRWQNPGCIDAILEALQLRLNEEGLIVFDLWCLDGSNVRAYKDAAGARKKHSGESSSRALTWRFWQQNSLDHRWSWFASGVLPFAGAISENQICDKCVGHGKDIDLIGHYRTRPTHLAADKAYSSRVLRAELRLRRIKAVIPQCSDQQRHHRGRPLVLDKIRYRRRNVVERCFGWLKKFRRFSTRYEKLAFCLRYLRELLADRKPAF